MMSAVERLSFRGDSAYRESSYKEHFYLERTENKGGGLRDQREEEN